ncbi:FlhC family transcriptional regulator [Paraburkholderia sp. RL17-337-BIB-A]|uniref:FlhC family transcriptional regulator n=1 Tax=Paraburkholderia sp. RL17-337-BIB-A TaxID=3031636 RepID=UPI0038BD06CC
MPKETTRNNESNTILLSDWLAEKIQRANFALTDFMHLALAGHREMQNVLGLSLDDMETFKQQIRPKATLMNMPFLALAPVLDDPRDWETFVDGAIFSQKIEKLTAEMPRVDQITSRDIFHYNHAYLQLLKDVLHMNLIAVPLLGISTELAAYLRNLPMARLENAIGAIRFPLFRWRFDDPNFWMEYGAGWLTEETVAHYLMRTSPLSAATLPYKSAWTDLRLERSEKEIFARMMMAQGCRASTATNLFNLNPTKARTTYKEIHGVSSPCGCNPSSLTWYVDQSVHRLQASVYAWLYRSALHNDGNIPQALIAANDIMAKMFGKNLLITADRANHLTRSMAMDSRLTMAACRSCSTDYVLSNGEGKIELAKDFSCPGCNYLLTPKSQAGKRKVPN